MATTKIKYLHELEIRSKQKKLTRAERNDHVRERLFQAAAKIVGRNGYAEASVARITEQAGYAQGTFYNHFSNRQELLDNLLPVLGKQMISFIRQRVDIAATETEKETTRFKAFFEFLREVPEFLRILNEAEFFAPTGYQMHLDRIATAYTRILRQSKTNDTRLATFSDEEIEAVVHILLGARGYLGQRYAYKGGTVRAVPAYVVDAYVKMLNGGLFQGRGKSGQTKTGKKK